jgi:hypothetical protein
MINKAWPGHTDLKDVGMNLMTQLGGSEWRQAFTQYDGVKAHIEAFKADLRKQNQ